MRAPGRIGTGDVAFDAASSAACRDVGFQFVCQVAPDLQAAVQFTDFSLLLPLRSFLFCKSERSQTMNGTCRGLPWMASMVAATITRTTKMRRRGSDSDVASYVSMGHAIV